MTTHTAAVIFDMDGLLIDSEKIWLQVESDLLATYGAAFDQEIGLTHIGLRWDEASSVIVREYGLDVEAEHFGQQLLEKVLVEFRRALELMPGAAELIEAVVQSGIPVAIASSSPGRVVRQVVEQYGWGDAIPVLCCGDEVPRGKPAPDVFLLAAERLGVEPERCVVLEDSLNGARAASAAGMFCIAVPDNRYSREAFQGIADRVVPSLRALTLEDLLDTQPA